MGCYGGIVIQAEHKVHRQQDMLKKTFKFPKNILYGTNKCTWQKNQNRTSTKAHYIYVKQCFKVRLLLLIKLYKKTKDSELSSRIEEYLFNKIHFLKRFFLYKLTSVIIFQDYTSYIFTVVLLIQIIVIIFSFYWCGLYRSIQH